MWRTLFELVGIAMLIAVVCQRLPLRNPSLVDDSSSLGSLADSALHRRPGPSIPASDLPQDPDLAVTDELSALRQRVTRIENLVFATAKLAVFDAERRLSALREELRESERLFFRGVITDAQLEADRYAVYRA